MEGPVIGLTWEEKRFIEKRVVGTNSYSQLHTGILVYSTIFFNKCF
jgi:hypothetical protein